MFPIQDRSQLIFIMFNARHITAMLLALSAFLPLSAARPATTRDLITNMLSPEPKIWDLTWIKKLAAVGDSYSAGIGAGNRLGGLNDLGAWACSRYDHAYPNLVNQMAALGDPKDRKFQFHSCSGATSEEILKDQLPRIDNGQDAILLSAGGNDVGFVSILNLCVFQFFAVSGIGKDMLEADGRFVQEGWKDKLASVALTCEETLNKAQDAIKDPKFANNIKNLITETKKKLQPGGTIFYTGYAKFWAEDMNASDQCSNINWSVGGHDKGALAGKGYQDKEAVKLIPSRRKGMNDLVNAINKKIEEVVKDSGDHVEFVNYDAYLGQVGSRFCEKGVIEPDTTRRGSAFYELDLQNPLGTGNFKRDGADVFEGTIEYEINQLADMAATSGRQYDGLNDKIETAPGTNPGPDNDSGKVGKRVINPLPDGYGRIFHPTIIGHILIADSVVYTMAKRQAAGKNLDMNAQPPDAALACPKPTTTEPLCVPYGDSSGKHECSCGKGSDAKRYKQKEGDDPCGYTTMPPDSSLATPTSTPPPGPTASALVIWHAPPKTGPMFYSFYKSSPGFRKSLVGSSCGDYGTSSTDFIKCNTIKDDKCRVDGARGEGKTPDRIAPGTVELGKELVACKYVEDKVGEAELRCPNNTNFKCKAPDDNLRQAITPDNGRCSATKPAIENVQTLVMVCEMFK